MLVSAIDRAANIGAFGCDWNSRSARGGSLWAKRLGFFAPGRSERELTLNVAAYPARCPGKSFFLAINWKFPSIDESDFVRQSPVSRGE